MAEATRHGRVRDGPVQRGTDSPGAGRSSDHAAGHLLQPQPRADPRHRRGGLAVAGRRAGRSADGAESRAAASPVPRAERGRDPPMRRCAPGRAGRHPRDPRRSAVGPDRDLHGAVDRRRAGRPPRRRGARPGGGARGVLCPGRVANPCARRDLRRLDPAQQGHRHRGPAGLADERRTASAGPRRTGSAGGPRLHRRPQRQVGHRHHRPAGTVEQLLPGHRLPAAPRRRRRRPRPRRPTAASRSARSRSTPTSCNPTTAPT